MPDCGGMAVTPEKLTSIVRSETPHTMNREVNP